MFFDVLGWMVHSTLAHDGEAWIVFILFLCMVSAVLSFAIGSIWWWHVGKTRLPKLWAKHRRELNRMIERKDQVIADQTEEIHFYKHRSFVAAVAMLQNQEEKEMRK